MKNNTVKTLGELELRELVDLGLRMPDGSTELFEVVNIANDCVTVMTKNIIDFMHFNARENKHSGNTNSYAESSIRKYLAELYQYVTKDNRPLLDNTFGAKEFFLPSASLLDLGYGNGWRTFKEDSSRVKYPSKYSVQKLKFNNLLEEPSWYWLSTPDITLGDMVNIIIADGSIDQCCVDDETVGVAPALNLEPSTSLTLNEGVWCLTEEKTSIEDSNVDIKIGDWVEVTHTAEIDIQEGILLGDCFEVVGFGEEQELIIKPSSTKTWYLFPDQVRKIKPPLTHHKKTQEPSEHDERLKGFYQHTAIEILKVYHTAHKVKKERINALNKALENIQELIKLEKENG